MLRTDIVHSPSGRSLHCAKAQSVAPVAFDVASIKPGHSEDRAASMQSTPPGGRFVSLNVSPMQLVMRAFSVGAAQVRKGLEWLNAGSVRRGREGPVLHRRTRFG